MNKLTYAEISEILNSDLFLKFEHDPEQWMWGDVYSSIDEMNNSSYFVGIRSNDDQNQQFEQFLELFQKLGKFQIVERYGGEGKRENYYKIWHFVDHDVYIQFDGWYASHHGSEFYGMFEVFPKLETKTVYKTRK